MNDASRPEDDLDPRRIDNLGTDECWQLLRSQPVGRIAVNVGPYPLVIPVNYALDGQCVVFRSGDGEKQTMIHGSKVTFEVDQIDADHHTGWSVLIKGVAHALNVRGNEELAERSYAGGAEPWAPGEQTYLVRVVPDEVTGRRIHPAQQAAP